MADPHPSPTDASLVDRLDEAQALVNLLVVGAPIVLFRWDLRSNQVRWCGQDATVRQTGVPREEDGYAWLARIHPDDRPSLRKALAKHLKGQTDRLEHTHRLVAPDGEQRWVSTKASVHHDDRGHPTHLIGAVFDEHARRTAEDRADWSARHDPLTGLPNRMTLVERLDQALARRHPERGAGGLLLINLDRFRTVNRALGPLVGDRLLCQAAELIRSMSEPEGFAGRLSGDQFAVVVDSPEFDVAALERLAHALVQALAAPMPAREHDVVLGGSVGVLWLDEQWTDSASALRDAERALAAAKAAGGHGWARFEPSDNSHAERLNLEARLRAGLRHGRFCLNFQPIVELPTRRIVAFEALVRWNDPELGFVSPAAFIPVAEETGLIVPLGDWILREACAALHRWRATTAGEHLRMNINLSAVQFGEAGLVERIDQILTEFPRARGAINLELTETALLEHPGRQAQTLDELRALGCQIHIDDFGTGYSSLSNLAQLPVDALKVDREFVMRAEDDPRSLAIVRMVARMAQEMQLSLTAEGIETEGQVSLLTALGPCRGQGYLFARPLTEEAALDQLVAPTTIARRWQEAG